ncbi:MAG: hypothetical protein NG784_05855 [Candidatus Jettenia sp.]|nr:hypothetical protein [Candidatus Jettenia sp.]
MNKDKNLKRIIIDASYLRASQSDGYQLTKLVEGRFRLILIDNLIFELCSTDAEGKQWLATIPKLYSVVNSIECWKHIGELLGHEANTQCPISTPLDKNVTIQLSSFLTSKQISLPNNFVSHLEYIRKQRERDSVESLLRACNTHEILSQKLKEQIVHRSGSNIDLICQDLVNNKDLIRLFIEGDKIFNLELVTDRWIAWHYYKSYIAFLCEYLRLNGTAEFSKLLESTQKRWINRKQTWIMLSL